MCRENEGNPFSRKTPGSCPSLFTFYNFMMQTKAWMPFFCKYSSLYNIYLVWQYRITTPHLKFTITLLISLWIHHPSTFSSQQYSGHLLYEASLVPVLLRVSRSSVVKHPNLLLDNSFHENFNFFPFIAFVTIYSMFPSFIPFYSVIKYR